MKIFDVVFEYKTFFRRSYQVETCWYKNYNEPIHGALIPKYIASGEVDEYQYLILEDLAQKDLRPLSSLSWKEVQDCLSWLADFHKSFLGKSNKGLWPIGTYWHLDTRPEEFEGLKVPEDISIIGFDDIEVASQISPALTTVAAPIKEIATQAFDILNNILCIFLIHSFFYNILLITLNLDLRNLHFAISFLYYSELWKCIFITVSSYITHLYFCRINYFLPRI